MRRAVWHQLRWKLAVGPIAAAYVMVGVLPGHAVVTLPNGATVYVGADLTGAALEQEINGVDNGLIVRGFCR